ncbi:MAG: hypothetical protein GY711_13545 [bacterium]|nr:hypothetical protein [bacterium]
MSDSLSSTLQDASRLTFASPMGLDVSLGSAADKSEIRTFGFRSELANDRYGIKSSELYAAEYANLDEFEYVVATDRKTGRIVGDLRLRFHYDPLQFAQNLTPEFRAYCEAGHHVVDIGGHIDRPPHEKLAVFQCMWTYLMRLRGLAGFDALYGQIRESYRSRFATIAHSVCTEPFTAPAWTGEWLGVWVDFQEVVLRWSEPEVQAAWKERTGIALDVDFFAAVDASLANSSLWIED